MNDLYTANKERLDKKLQSLRNSFTALSNLAVIWFKCFLINQEKSKITAFATRLEWQ